MAAYGALAEQTIQPGGFAVFNSTLIPCYLGLIQHADETPLFNLSGIRSNSGWGCPCMKRPVYYKTAFNANVALAPTATVEPISVSISVEGVAFPLSEMDSTPAAVSEFNHIGTEVPIPILDGCCQNVAVQNTGTQPIVMRAALIDFDKPNVN